MKILAIEQEVGSPTAADFTPYLKAEAQQVLVLFEQGVIRELYFNQHHQAVLILECDSMHEAQEVVSTLPLVQNKLISFQLSELHPYTGFSRLLNKS